VSRTIRKIPNEARPQNRNLAGATVNAPGVELANSSHSHECIVDSHLQVLDGNRAFGGIGFSDLMLGGAALGGDDGHVDVLAKRKILISVQKVKKKKGTGEVTKVEGIPEVHDLCDLLKKLKAKDMLSCGGHVAEDKATGSKLRAAGQVLGGGRKISDARRGGQRRLHRASRMTIVIAVAPHLPCWRTAFLFVMPSSWT